MHQTLSPQNTSRTLSKFERPERLTGFPLFFESCGNVMTESVNPVAVENVMQLALKQYERNLRQAKRAQ